eukprot:COSAG02_NODE_5046_length_4699_cov_2.745652_6_plen_54_part_00
MHVFRSVCLNEKCMHRARARAADDARSAPEVSACVQEVARLTRVGMLAMVRRA